MPTIFLLLFIFSFAALIVGIIKPSVYSKIFRRLPTRWFIVKIFGGAMLAFFIALAVVVPPVEKTSAPVNKPMAEKTADAPNADQIKTSEKTVVKIVEPIAKQDKVTPPTVSAQPTNTSITPPLLNNRQSATIVNVVDGDTVAVTVNGIRETIRIIGINTPETVDPRKPVECFGKESSAQAKKLLDGKTVQLEADVTQGERDKYSRLLRYIFLADNTDFGKQMINDGYAYEYTYATPYKYQQAYKAAQTAAQSAKRGLWSTSTCNGQKAVTSPTNANTSPTPSTSSSANSNSSSSTTPTCDIKGNISSTGEKIYHLPACDSYSKTVIDTSKGERWFCSEQDAVIAGWRKALNCP